jgi:hypothetical protein
MKLRKNNVIIVALVSVCLILVAIPVRASTRTINSVEDSTIDQSYPTQNNGGRTDLLVDQARHDAVIKFDLSPISGVFYEAQFGFEVMSLGGPINLSIYEMMSTWTEMGVNWNNAPPLGTHIIDLYIDETAFYLINITVYAQIVHLAQLGSLSVRLMTNDSNWVRIACKETVSQEQRPQMRFYFLDEPSIGIDLSIFVLVSITSGVTGIFIFVRRQYRRK